MKIDCVTVTGADDSTSIEEMKIISNRFPFVEWGILVSDKAGRNRFPSEEWLELLSANSKTLALSCHVCGRWVRQICQGELDKKLEKIWGVFPRVQLNFHSKVHEIEINYFMALLSDFPDKQFIFQLDNVNNDLLDMALQSGINVVALFDTSGGCGCLPEYWPQMKGYYCGYAGGLSPKNLQEELLLIEQVVDNRTIWIDAETHLRSNNDTVFDMQKVREFLAIVEAGDYIP